MKDFWVNIVIVIIVLVLYYFNVLELFTSKYFSIFMIGIILLLFLVAIKILGNPFSKDDHDD